MALLSGSEASCLVCRIKVEIGFRRQIRVTDLLAPSHLVHPELGYWKIDSAIPRSLRLIAVGADWRTGAVWAGSDQHLYWHTYDRCAARRSAWAATGAEYRDAL